MLDKTILHTKHLFYKRLYHSSTISLQHLVLISIFQPPRVRPRRPALNLPDPPSTCTEISVTT
jgi:hypothetical protein